MSPLLLTGKEAADVLLQSLAADIKRLYPKLVIVQVGDDKASSAYVRRKLKALSDIQMSAQHLQLPADTTVPELLSHIQALNEDKSVSGFLVQLPLPEHLWSHIDDIINAIDPRKDIDGFTDLNRGKLFRGDNSGLSAATPLGILTLLDHYSIPIAGRHCVIIGRSNIVGRPLSLLLLQRDATVTVCHSKTPNIAEHTQNADIVISAVGKAKLITKDMVKPGAVVVDVGLTRTDEGLVGDVDFDAVAEVASAITPMPGGVGPMTVACVIANCVKAAKP